MRFHIHFLAVGHGEGRTQEAKAVESMWNLRGYVNMDMSGGVSSWNSLAVVFCIAKQRVFC